MYINGTMSDLIANFSNVYISQFPTLHASSCTF